MSPLRRRDLLKSGALATAGLTFGVATGQPLAAGALVDPGRAALEFRGGRGPRSGLAWHSGGFGDGFGFEAWRGRPFDVFTTFVNYDTWAMMLAFPGNTLFGRFAKQPVWLALAYPWLPRRRGDTVFTSFWDEAAEFDPARQTPAARLFWSRHRQILGNIKDTLGTNTTYRGLILRVAWEFNGASFCKLDDYRKCPQYRAIFRRFVAEARKRIPDVVIEWNPLRKGTEGARFADIYPGDEFVDIVSICHYDRAPSFDSREIWDEQAVRRNVETRTTCVTRIVNGREVETCSTATLWDNPWGIETWAAFAVQHRKKFGVPEWGLTNGWTNTNNCLDRDNPLYMELMFKFFNDHADIMGYESYFNRASRHMIYPPGQVPYSRELEVDASRNACDVASLNWPGRATSVNDVAARRYKELVRRYYDLANPA